MESILKYLEQLGIKPDVVFSTSVSITIFVIGFALNRWNDYRIERRRLREIQAFVFEYLRSILVPINQQIDFFKQFSGRLNSPQIQTLLFSEGGIRSNYLLTLPQLDVFRALVHGNRRSRRQRIKDFNHIQESLSYFDRLTALSKQQFEYLLHHETAHLSEWNNATDTMIRHFENWKSVLLRSGLKPSDDQFLVGLDRIVLLWQNSNDRQDIAIMLSALVNPIKEYCVKHFQDARAMVLIPLTLSARYAYDNRANLRRAMSVYYRTSANEMESHVSIFQEILTRNSHAKNGTNKADELKNP